MDLKKINEVLSDIRYPNLKKVSDKQPGGYWSEKDQGDTAHREVIFDLEDGSGLFLKITYEVGSYGEEETVISVQFVEPKEKTVVVYE